MQTLSSKELVEFFLALQKDKHSKPEKYQGMQTGIPDLDKILGGFQKGWYIVIGGPQKSGKTTFMVTLAIMFAQSGAKVLWSGFEMNNEQMAAKVFSNISGIEINKFRDVQLEETDWPGLNAAGQVISEYDTYWNYGASSLDDLTGLIEEYDPDVVFADYIQLMSINGWRGSRQEEIAKISRTLKQHTLSKRQTSANECGPHDGENSRLIIAGSQINREGIKGNDYSSANMFRDSGALEQDADVAIIMAPVIDPGGEVCEEKRKIHIVASRWSGRTSFLVDFMGARSLVTGSAHKEYDMNEMVQNYLNECPCSNGGDNGSNSRGKPW